MIQSKIEGETIEGKIDKLIKTAEGEYQKCKNIIEEIGIDSKAISTIVAPLKGKSRIVDKVYAEYGGKVEKITDIVRSTLLYNNVEELKEGFYTILHHPSVQQIKYKNRLDNNNPRHAGCRDMLINIQLDNGFVFEIQLHIPEILKTKDPGLFSTLSLDNIIDKNPYIFTPEIYNLSEVGKGWTIIDNNILQILKKRKIKDIESSKILTNEDKKKDINKRNKKQLPNNGETIAGHDIYDIIRELPTNDIDFGKTERVKYGIQFNDIQNLVKTLNNIQNNLNDQAIKDYNNRTKSDYNPNTFIL